MTSSQPARVSPLQPTLPASGELLSALADDQLAPQDIGAVLAGCREDGDLLDQWASYHLIGDALRSPRALGRPVGRDFAGSVMQRLAEEPALRAAAVPAVVIHHRGAAANDSAFRWKMAAGFASLAAVSAIAWTASGLMGAPATAPQLAQSTTAQPILVASPAGPMVRDARLEELLAAHRQLGGGSAIEAPSGFLRNAAFETSQSAGR